MRILYWVPLFWPNIGGIEKIAAHSVRELSHRGHELRIVTSFGEWDLPSKGSFMGIPVIRLPFFRALNERNLFLIKTVQSQLEDLAVEFQPDWIHLHMGAPLAFFYLNSKILRTFPLILTVHQKLMGVDGGKDTILWKICQKASWIVGVSHSVLGDILKLSPTLKGCSSVIYNGIPDENHLPHDDQPRPHRLLCVGRLVEEKGFDLPIKAASQLKSSHPNLRLGIAGNGPERQNLIKLVEDLDVIQNVDFLGWLDQDQVYQEMRQAALVMMPSRVQEAFPLTAVESAMLGKPLVASRTGGLVEAVVDGETGCLLPDRDVESWVNCIAELLSKPDKIHMMGRNARSLYLEQFTLEQNIHAYEMVYRQASS